MRVELEPGFVDLLAPTLHYFLKGNYYGANTEETLRPPHTYPKT